MQFIVRKLFDDNVLSLFDLVESSSSIGTDAVGSGERIAIIGYALNLASSWLFGIGLGAATFHEAPSAGLLISARLILDRWSSFWAFGSLLPCLLSMSSACLAGVGGADHTFFIFPLLRLRQLRLSILSVLRGQIMPCCSCL